MARILLIRHAPTPETGTRLTGRLPGVSLGEEGVERAREVAKRLESLKLSAIYASPIDRTWETAQEIGHVQGVSPVADDDLMEVDYGTWSGRTLKSLYRLKAWRVVQTTPSRMQFPEGESLADAQRRAVAAVERIARQHARQTVAAVTHADIIKAVLAHLLGTPLDLFQRISVSPTSVSAVDIPAQGQPRILAMNTNGDPDTWR